MIRAVIFDCFGVLTTDAWLPFKTKYFGHEQALLDRASELNKQSDAGFISADDFVVAIGKMAGLSAREVETAISNNVPNDELFDYVAQLKDTYKIGMLSNASANWITDLFTPAQTALFDTISLSYETHFTKPMAQAYETVADKLGVMVGECIFIDDQERFVTGASEAGMPAIWYQDNQQLMTALDRLLATDSKR